MTFKCLKHIANYFVAFANPNIIQNYYYTKLYLLTICYNQINKFNLKIKIVFYF